MLTYIWLALIVIASLLGGFSSRIPEVVDGAVKGAESAVTLSIGLIGLMSLWLGLMRLAEQAGLVGSLAWLLRPLLRRLFPDVPVDHPAMGSMVMNLAANMLGLVNAATPLGLRAIRDLETLNRIPGTATNAMCTFLAVNTSSVQLIPMTAVAVLAANGARNPTAIIGTALLATFLSTVAGILAVKTLERLRWFRLPRVAAGDQESSPAPPASAEPAAVAADRPFGQVAWQAHGPPPAPLTWWAVLVLVAFLACFLWFALALTFPQAAAPSAAVGPGTDHAWVRAVNAVSLLAIPFLVALFPLYAALRGIPVYEEFVEGAKEGFQTGVRIIPYLVAMLVAIGMFRGAGGIEWLTAQLQPVLTLVGFPAELLPMALVRPLSGSASIAIFSDLAGQFGGDHLISRMAGTLLGSTETTLYVVAVYFGAVNVRRTRHAVPAGLIADAVGVVASVFLCRWVFGG